MENNPDSFQSHRESGVKHPGLLWCGCVPMSISLFQTAFKATETLAGTQPCTHVTGSHHVTLCKKTLICHIIRLERDTYSFLIDVRVQTSVCGHCLYHSDKIINTLLPYNYTQKILLVFLLKISLSSLNENHLFLYQIFLLISLGDWSRLFKQTKHTIRSTKNRKEVPAKPSSD